MNAESIKTDESNRRALRLLLVFVEIFEQVVQIVREKQDEIDELQEQYQKLQETCHQSIPPSSDYFLPSTSMPWLAYILPASMIQVWVVMKVVNACCKTNQD